MQVGIGNYNAASQKTSDGAATQTKTATNTAAVEKPVVSQSTEDQVVLSAQAKSLLAADSGGGVEPPKTKALSGGGVEPPTINALSGGGVEPPSEV